MTTIQNDTGFEDIQPADLALYARMARPESIRAVTRHIGMLRRELFKLRELGQEDAAKTTAVDRINLELLRLMAIPAASINDLKQKQRILVAQVDLLKETWLVDPVIGAALVMDYQNLNLSPHERGRLRSMLPIEGE